MTGSGNFHLRRILILYGFVSTLTANAAMAQLPLRPDESRTLGTAVPDVTLIGEDSTSFSLSRLAGKPIVVSPIFTACPHTCSLITSSLRDALGEIGEPGAGYQVLTVSFDPADGPAALREYRRTMALPDGWTLAVASRDELSRLLDAIDFNYEPMPEGGFAHANVIAVLTPTLEVSGYVHGVTYQAKEIRGALEKATRESSLVHHYRPYILLIAALGLAAVAVVLLVTRKKATAA